MFRFADEMLTEQRVQEMLPVLNIDDGLIVSLTRCTDGANVTKRRFDSHAELVRTLAASCYIPYVAGNRESPVVIDGVVSFAMKLLFQSLPPLKGVQRRWLLRQFAARTSAGAYDHCVTVHGRRAHLTGAAQGHCHVRLVDGDRQSEDAGGEMNTDSVTFHL